MICPTYMCTNNPRDRIAINDITKSINDITMAMYNCMEYQKDGGHDDLNPLYVHTEYLF